MSEERAPSPRPKCRSLMGVQIISTGSYVPDQVITNAALEEQFGCDADWIVKRTGILERRHAWPYQATSDLAFEAGNRCLKSQHQTQGCRSPRSRHLHSRYVFPLDRLPTSRPTWLKLRRYRNRSRLRRLHVCPHHRRSLCCFRCQR